MHVRAVTLALAIATAGALAATAIADAQPRHGGGGRNGGGPGAPTNATTPPPKPPKPENQIEITGIVRAIDPAAQRITIAYDAIDELGWPRGTMPFTVYNAALLTSVTVGEHVRFKLDSQQITEIGAF